MLSKNNRHLQEQRMSDSKQRFSIRKYSFGAASVLLGLSFMTYAGGSPVSADTTDQPAVTVTEPTDKASTAQTTAASEATASTATSEASSTATSEAAKQTSEASSTATSESAKQTSEAVSSTAPSESAAETTQSSETASKETVTSEAAKESTAPSEASKISTATSEASEKASTAASESTTPAKVTSEENSQEQTTSSETVDTNALTAPKVAKTSALLAALKSVKLAAATTATTDDSLSSSGEITAAGKDKGLEDTDVGPKMSNANGASLKLDNSNIPSVYKADPTEGRYTFGVISFGGDFDPGTSEKGGKTIKNTTYNTDNNTKYYLRFSTKAAATDGKYDDSTVYAQVVDAANDQVTWEGTLTPQAEIKNILSTYTLTYTTSTTNGLTTAQVNLSNSIGTQYTKVVYSAAGDQSMGTFTHVTIPISSTITTEYIAKDADGTETKLATYEETGRQGYTYTASGVRSFAGYDLISSPSSTTGTLSRFYKVGDVLERAREQLSDKYQIASVYVITKTDGTAKMEMKIASVDASTNEYADENVWHTFLTTAELAPGEVSTDGNYDPTPDYKNGAFLLYDSTYKPIGVKYLTDIGISSDDLTRTKLEKYRGYLTVFGLNNKLAKGQEPVQYIYAPQGQVRINYVTSDGTAIQTPVTAYKNSATRTAYDVTGSTYRPATITVTVNGKTYRYVKSDKSLGTAGTTDVNGYTYTLTPSDATGTITSNTVNDVYYVYEQVKYHTEVGDSKTVTRTIEYYDSVTGDPIPKNLEPTVKQSVTLTGTKIYDDKNNFIGYGTVSDDGSSYTIDQQTWTQQDSADLSDYGYTAPDRASVAAVTVDHNTADVTEKVYYGHQTTPVKPTDPKTTTDKINPKGDVTYPDGVSKDDLNASVTRTINYVDEDGNKVNGAPNKSDLYKQTAEFTRTAIVDKVTGEILGYDTDNDGKVDTENKDRAWMPTEKTLEAVKSADPSSVGYDKVDKSTVESLVVTPDQAVPPVIVTYSNNPVSGTIKYIDDTTGKELDSDNLKAGKIGSIIDYKSEDEIKSYEAQGYELVSNNFTDGKQTYAKTGNDFVVHLKHATEEKTTYRDATQTIHYVGAGDKTPSDKVQTQKNAFSKTDTIDKVTGEIIKSTGWTGTKTFGTEDTPVVEGYHADKKTAGGLTATPDNPDVEANVTYSPNGKLVPVDPNNNPIPGADTPTYKTDPDDPTTVVPNEPIPDVPNYTPVDPSPVTPTNPGENTPVPYYQVSGTIKYVDDTTKQILSSEDLQKGKVGSKIDYTTADKIKNYVDQGYELVSNDFTDGSQVYKESGNNFTVHLKHATQTITPNDPNPVTPGTPINPKDPNSPVYGEETDRKNLVKDATQTIHYVGAGDKTPADKVQTQKDAFTRTVTIDKVTGKVLETSAWEGTKTFGFEVTPRVEDYHADKKTAGGLTATVDNPDVKETVTYSPNGKIVPVDPEGNEIPGADTPTYPTDPDDPTKVTPDEPTPNVPGYKTDVPKVTPKDPGTDTKVPYKKLVKGTIKYVDDVTGATLTSADLPEDTVGSKINYTTEDKIKSYVAKGYKFVSSDFTDGSQVYKESGNDFTVHLTHQTVPVTPEDPKNPGDPIIPGGNVTYPEGVTEKDLKDTVTRTIKYVDAKGNPVNGSPEGKSSYVQTVTFERTAIVDKVTGKILGYDTNKDGKADTDDPNRAWKPLSADLGEVKSADPTKLGFAHVDKSAVSKETVVPGQADLNEKVVYSNNPMVVSGTIKYVDDTTGVTLDEDVLPSGEVGSKINYTTADKITYYENKGYDLVSNDFKDGTTTYAKEGNKFEVHLKHKTQTITPNDPNPVTPGNPINPKDPNSPVYGEETDRKNLVKDATQTIHYVGAGDKTPADKKQTQKEAFTRTVTIDKVTGKVLETSAWEGTKTFGFEDTPFVEGYHANKKSEGGLTATPDNPDVKATVTYTPNGKLIPVDEEGVHIKDTDTPTYKTDPNDPTKVVDPTVPEVEGYQPRDNKVGDKVTPKDPAKDTEVVYVKTPETKYGLTEKFVDVDGNELLPSESKGTEYKTGETYDVTKDAKVINGYVLIDTDETTGTFDKSDKTATFIYKKVGKIIPVDKDHNPIPGADTPTYENNPDDPTKVTPNEPTPTVPGWTTDVPNVTPEDPTKDTPVVYTQNKYGLTEKFVDVDGNELSPSESKGTEYKTGDKYDVTKDAKVITGYVLVDTDETTGTFDRSDKTATFIYKKVGKIIPVDPNGNPIPGADTPTYENDPDDPTKVTPNEPTPGVPGYKTDVPNVTPDDPTKDTPVPYTKNETPETKYGLLEKFVDEEGNELAESVDKGSDYKTGDKFDVTKDAKVITGYVLVKTEGTTGTFTDSGKLAVFTYKKVGKIVPVDPKGNPIPDADTPTYKNDPDDPSKVVPNEPTPTVPGWTTDVPNVTPEDPTKDTPVPYTKNETPAAKYGLTEKFVDENGNDLVPSVSKGTDYKSGDKYDVTKDAKVITGYVLVKTTDTTGTFDKSDKTAVFTYKKLGKIVPVDPKGNPIPGADTPTYKNDPDDPSKVVPNEPTPSVPGYKTDVPKVTPEGPTKDTPVPYTKNETPAAKYGLTEKFVDENGNDLVPSVSKGTDYKSGDKYDVTKDAKVITGYVLVKTTDTTGTFEKSDKTAVFTYKKLGKIVPVDPKGNPIPGADTPTYKNDPDDPSKVVPNEPTPSVPGYKTDVPKVIPEDPTKDTPVPYTKNETPAAKYGLTEKFVDENGNDLVPSVSKGTDYKSGDKYDVTKDAKVITGYVLVKTTDTTGTFTDGNKTAVFTYKKLGKIVPVDPNSNPIPGADTPTYKNDPDDPSKVVPNEPTPSVPGYKTDVPKVTPEDPTKDTPVPYTKNETPAAKYGLTEKFVDENGNDLVPSVSKGTDYKSGDKYDVTKDAKVITGYVLVKTTDTTGTFTDGNKTAVFTYKKLGKIVPVDPKGNPIPGADTPTYKNDPDDPSKVVPNEPTPSVPGYKTDVPNVTPEDPTKDTPVVYTKKTTPETPAAKYGLTEKFVDENGNDLVPSVSKGTDYKSGDKYDVTKDAKVITGYVLVKTTDTTGTFGDSDKTAVFTYKKIGKIVPVDKDGNPIPGAETPSYKNDPSDPSKVLPNEPTPDVLGYKTDVPSVTPEDPTKDTPVPYTKNVTPSKPSNNKPGKKGAPSAPTGPTSPTLPGSKKGKTAPATPNATAFSTGASKQTASLKQNAQAKLPQTGEATDKSRALSVLGLGVMALTALLGLAIDKKRKN